MLGDGSNLVMQVLRLSAFPDGSVLRLSDESASLAVGCPAGTVGVLTLGKSLSPLISRSAPILGPAPVPCLSPAKFPHYLTLEAV
jgi:hypothetical protein